MKTLKELTEMISKYESKWGKLGHTNIINPEKNTIYHSGTNKDISQGGNKTMSRMDNDLYKFRQKVAAGKEANKLAHKSYISPEELNKMNYEQLMKSRTLVHAQNPLYGQQLQNTKYYKREGEPGHYRYYYTKEEWDAAHKQGNASTEANREAQERQQYETNKKIENYKNKQNVTNTSSNTRENNLQADFTKKFSDIARQSPEAAAKEIVNDENTKIKTLYNKVNDGFRKGIITWKNGRFEKGENASDSDYENIKNEIETYSDQLEKLLKGVDTAAGSGRKTKDAVAKIMADEIESMYQKAEKGKGNLKANQNAREEAIKKSQETNKEPKVSKEYKEELEYNSKKNNYGDADNKSNKSANVDKDKASDEYKEAIGEKKPSKSENNESWKERQDKILDDAMKGDANLKDLASKYGVSEEYIQELVYNVTGKTLKKEDKSTAKHSTSGKSLITNSSMGEEIMDEYAIFQQKVKRGKEMNRIAHSTFISPEELNAKYEKDLKSQGILVHGGNYKYYNKINLPNGTTRYFYTKAEWDAYQDGKGQDAKKKQEEIIRKNKEASQHEGDRYAKKSLPKSATMTDEERKEMYEDLAKKAKIHNQQVSNFEKNKAAAAHEGDRWLKVDSKYNTKPSEVADNNKVENNNTEKDDFFKKEHTEYVQKNGERIINDYNKAAEDEHNVSLQIDEKYGFNKAKTDEELNKCWDNLVQDMYQAALKMDNPDKCYMNFFWHDENGNGSAGWDISIPEFDKWAQEYQKEIDEVFQKGMDANDFDEKKKYGDQWEAMNEELNARTMEAKTKTLQMVTKLKKKCLET